MLTPLRVLLSLAMRLLSAAQLSYLALSPLTTDGHTFSLASGGALVVDGHTTFLSVQASQCT